MVIYKTTNLVNGKQYIGRDSHNNPNYLGSGISIRSAIKKYGKENFKKEILEVCSSQEELKEREEYWLNYYDAGGNDMFYNMHNSSCGAEFGKPRSEETKRKLREMFSGEKSPNYGKPLSEETKRKLRESHLGQKNHFFGKKHSNNTKELIRQSRVGNPLHDSTKQKLRERFQGENNPMYGKKHSEKIREKISNQLVGKFIGEKNPMYGRIHSEETRRKISEARITDYVVCVSGQYQGQKKTRIEWAEFLKIDRRNFSKHLGGKQYKNGIRGNFFKWERDI